MSTQSETIAKLHQDHLNSKHFMRNVEQVVEPFYDDWHETHSWEEISKPEALIIPSVWPGICDGGKAFDAVAYAKLCTSAGISGEQSEALYDAGLGLILSQAQYSDLYEGAAYSAGLDAFTIHKTDRSIFTAEKFVAALPVDPYEATMGDVILTNIGEGGDEAYLQLHDARLRCARFIADNLRPTLDQLALDNDEDTDRLSRATDARERGDDSQVRPVYNPLAHAMIEGMLSIGQSVNYLVQSGVEGQTSAEEDMKELLANHAPAVMSRVVINAHLGPNQAAGLSIRKAAVRSERGVHINPKLVEALRAKRDGERAGLQDLSADDLEWLQTPSVQTVNRFEGCPANPLIRLMDRMLLDALSVNEE